MMKSIKTLNMTMALSIVGFIVSGPSQVFAKKNQSAGAAAEVGAALEHMGIGIDRQATDAAIGNAARNTPLMDSTTNLEGKGGRRAFLAPAVDNDACQVAPVMQKQSNVEALVAALQSGEVNVDSIFAAALNTEGRETIVQAASDGVQDQLDDGAAILKAAVAKFVTQFKAQHGKMPSMDSWQDRDALMTFLEDEVGPEVVAACAARN